ncbi:RagB/SusD family nutrient uptake outer membrane protein [Pedobacter frigoris]|uniref:RagB/SusD family nutrient uptake outer membrane protein n=1 Tax=Pedobacter frigoris TaxID=2571272 RepID=A0A4U1CHB7_9SPHI|nr:RagB/SusD family nutrient uptake outer membrane protein [Pedobacter frigoris]TKC05977.1 RagB/SusD family nutrient uptake outer membrane protein [Pedobacter frigoris]
MKLKNITILLPVYLFGLLLSFSSCKKWLDVDPKTQVKEAKQFSTRQGYVDALFGIYQSAAEISNYGGQLSYRFLDILAQRYENKSATNTLIGKTARYIYTDSEVQTAISVIFNSQYKIVSQANFILKNIDNSEGVLDDNTLNIIKGEALAMRAYIHFDLARLFSERYDNGANAGKPSVAYLKSFTVTPQTRLTLGEVIANCEADLKEAESLLSSNQEIDQIVGNQGSTNADLFLQYRQNHMNYWAVKALLARLYLYKGDKPNALKYSKEVIQSTKFKFITSAEINVDAGSTASDLTFTSEHIFSIYVSSLKARADDVFKNTTTTGETTDLWSTRAKLDATYQASLVGYGTDVRRPGASKSLWNEIASTTVYTKKYWSDAPTNVKQRLIPLIKLSEMYYIAAEASATIQEGISYLNVVRTNRLIPELPAPATQAAFDTEIQFEYRKDFYAEGQLWFYYKRMNVLTLPDGISNPMTTAKYVFPIPNDELEFGLAGN